jgi:hypothetical protein
VQRVLVYRCGIADVACRADRAPLNFIVEAMRWSQLKLRVEDEIAASVRGRTDRWLTASRRDERSPGRLRLINCLTAEVADGFR